MNKQFQALIDTLKSDEDLKHLELEIDETCASVEIVGGLHKYYETFELSCDKRTKRYDLMINKPFCYGEMLTSVKLQRLINHDIEFCIYPESIVFYMVNLELDKLIETVKFLILAID